MIPAEGSAAAGRAGQRVRPGVLVALGVVVVYAALIAVDDVLPGGSGEDIADPALSFLRSHVLPLGTIAALLVLFVTRAGWSREVWRERPEQRVPRWWLAFPVLYVAVVAGNLTQADWSQATTLLLVLLVGTLLVGFTEELAVRGILLTGARASMPELPAFLLTCLVFGALHGLNLLTGAPLVPTLLQMAAPTGFGGIYYAVRRSTGRLWPAMPLHALNDFSLYAGGADADATDLGRHRDGPAGRARDPAAGVRRPRARHPARQQGDGPDGHGLIRPADRCTVRVIEA